LNTTILLTLKKLSATKLIIYLSYYNA